MNPLPRPRNHLLQSLPEPEFEALRPHLEEFELFREDALAEAGAPLTRVYLPHSGAISMMVRLSEGQTVEVAMIGRDSILRASAALDDGISLTDAVVLLPGFASVIDLATLRAVADQSPALRYMLARHEQALFAQAQQSGVCNASHSVEARLSRWLLRARDMCDSETLPLTQELLAQLIGVQRNAVSIVAHALQRAGIIRYSRGHIDIRNAEALRQSACECYEAVTTHHRRLLSAAP